MRKCHIVHSSRLSNVGSQDTKSFYLWLQDFRYLGDFFFFFFNKKSNQSKIKGGFLKMWISWTPQIQVYICDIQSWALNNFYSSLGNLSVESERKSQKKTNQTNKIHVVQLSKDSQNEKPVDWRLCWDGYLIPTIVPFLNACLLTHSSMTGPVLRTSAKAVSRS